MSEDAPDDKGMQKVALRQAEVGLFHPHLSRKPTTGLTEVKGSPYVGLQFLSGID